MDLEVADLVAAGCKQQGIWLFRVIIMAGSRET